MEVISGMAPRPSTPQGLPHGKSARSLSAPNSPARSVPGNFPGINRLPSQDSLDRSIHNESGHGKSTAQIIKDLKHSNASLSAKQAGLEAQFMNQLSEVTRSFEDQRVKMDADIRSLKKQLAHLDAYKAAADLKLKEKDAALSKVKEESAFQRHSISDLKNQLYQLQTELEDAQRNEGTMMPRGAQEEMQQLLSDNQEMARELAKMHTELRESERARHDLERSMGYGKPPAPPSNSGESPIGYYQKYQETHSELERHRKRLSVTQTKVDGLEAEKQFLVKTHAKTVEELQEELVKQSQLFKYREQDLMAKIESLEGTDTQVTVDLKRQMDQKDDDIAAMQDEIDQCNQKIADLASQLSQAQQAAASQENYRRDEAEDLRILHDAQEEEITKLRKQLEEAQKELDMRDEELQESNARLQTTGELTRSSGIDKDHKQLEETKAKLAAAELHLKHLADASSVEQMEGSRKQFLDLQEAMARTSLQHEQQTKELKASIELLTAEKARISQKLEELEKEKRDALSKSEENDNEFSKLRSHWEVKAGAAHEVESLKSEIEIHRQRAMEASENERAANGKLQQLSDKVSTLQKELDSQRKIAGEAKAKLEENLAKESSSRSQGVDTASILSKSKKEIEDLRKAIQSHEVSAHQNAKQLREAQIALVALDDEKKLMSEKHRDLLKAVEKKKDDMQQASDARLKTKEMEIRDLKKRIEELEASEAGKTVKLKDRLMEAEALESAEIKRLRDQLASLRADMPGRTDKRSLEPASRAIPVSPEASAGADTNMGNAEMDAVVRSLSAENDALKTKLKDRDTTISALVRSSVSLESKISNMKNELNDIRSVQSEEKKAAEGDLTNMASIRDDRNPKASEEVVTLRKELKLAKQDASRWKLALEETGGSGSDLRYQITMLHKELDESVDRLKERDQAIENLVNQSMSQDAHVKDLKTRLSSLMKEMEKRRSYGSALLESEVERLQNETEIFAGQIIEQDEEIQNLRRRLQQRDDQVQLLKQELADMRERVQNSPSSADALEEIERLKRDVSRITLDLRARDEEILHLQKKVESTEQKLAHADPSQVRHLQAELDELRDANEDRRAELRDLRKQLWEAKKAAGEANDLKHELAQAQYAFDEYKRTHTGAVGSKEDKLTIEKLKLDLQARESKIAELESSTASNNEKRVAATETEIAALRKDVAARSEMIERLNDEIKSKNAAIEKGEAIKLKILGELSSTKDTLKSLMVDTSEKARSIATADGEKLTLRRENDELRKTRDAMALEIAELQKTVESVEAAREVHEDAKIQLEKAQQAREASEKSIIDAYEKRISALNLEKETSIDDLRGELTAIRGQKADEADSMTRQVKSLQSENDSLREQLELELHAKDQQVYALEHTLHAQEQIVQNMRAEMDQLQSGMEHATEKRRGEIEDLQQELMQLEGRALKQEREITALKMQQEESKLEHKTEVVRLKEALANMEIEGPLAKTMASLQNDDRMLQVRERLEQLKARNTALQEENLKLGGRLERKVIEIKSLEFEKNRAEELEHENNSLRRQVKELGSILESARPKSSRSSVAKKQPPPSDDQPSSSTSVVSDTSATKEKPVKGKKGIKGLFKRREVTVIPEGEED
jgi:chromosome segregation ATPase